MVAKFGEARRRAFLIALRATGNQTLAAERTKVSRSWVQLHRAGDPAFRQACEDAVAAAQVALRQAQREWGLGCKPPSGWGYLDGEELVVKGTGGSGGGKRVQIARSRLKQWSPRVEQRFLVTLGATCNVKAACAEVELTAASAYNHRRRWPAFKRRWDAALEDGYVQLEAGLVYAAGNFLSGEDPAEIGPITGMTVAYALELYESRERQERARSGRRRSRRWWAREPDIEEVRASIMRKVEAMERHDPERLKRDQAEWARRRENAAPRADESPRSV